MKFYKYKENTEFINDKAFIDDKIKKKDFKIIDDEYEYRVNMLLEI